MSLTDALFDDAPAELVKQAAVSMEQAFQAMSKDELKRYLRAKTAEEQSERRIGGLGKHVGTAAAVGGE